MLEKHSEGKFIITDLKTLLAVQNGDPNVDPEEARQIREFVSHNHKIPGSMSDNETKIAVISGSPTRDIIHRVIATNHDVRILLVDSGPPSLSEVVKDIPKPEPFVLTPAMPMEDYVTIRKEAERPWYDRFVNKGKKKRWR